MTAPPAGAPPSNGSVSSGVSSGVPSAVPAGSPLSPRETGERARAQRERILRAAKRCFVEHGFHAASIADIARTAEMSAGLIYL